VEASRCKSTHTLGGKSHHAYSLYAANSRLSSLFQSFFLCQYSFTELVKSSTTELARIEVHLETEKQRCHQSVETQHIIAAKRCEEWDAEVDEIMANMTTLEIIGQMTEIAIYGLTNSTYQLDEDALREYAKLHVGSYIGIPMSV